MASEGQGVNRYYREFGCIDNKVCKERTLENYDIHCCNKDNCNRPNLKLCYSCSDLSSIRTIRCSEGGYFIESLCHSNHFCGVRIQGITLTPHSRSIFIPIMY